MTPETGTLIVRQTFLDRDTETPAKLHIECIHSGDGDGRPAPLTPAQIDAGLKSASTLVAGASLLFAKWARDFQKHSNALPRFDQDTSNAAGGDPNIAYYHSHWALGPDEALVIEATRRPASTGTSSSTTTGWSPSTTATTASTRTSTWPTTRPTGPCG